jgi:hypothetical protein
MQQGCPTSFSRIFGAGGDGRGETAEEASTPSVHELFAAAMRDELTLRQFAEALVQLHGIRLTPGAMRLLSSVDATSGRLSFSQFQRALQEDGDAPGEAGKKTVFRDQAHAIIRDNDGAPSAPPKTEPVKHATDISADPFMRQKARVEKVSQSRGSYGANPVVPTNRASAGNPLVAQRLEAESNASEDAYGDRDMANTAVRMFVSGDLDRKGFEDFLERFGVQLKAESDLQRLVLAHEKVGDGSFLQVSRALQKEIRRP